MSISVLLGYSIVFAMTLITLAVTYARRRR